MLFKNRTPKVVCFCNERLLSVVTFWHVVVVCISSFGPIRGSWCLIRGTHVFVEQRSHKKGLHVQEKNLQRLTSKKVFAAWLAGCFEVGLTASDVTLIGWALVTLVLSDTRPALLTLFGLGF